MLIHKAIFAATALTLLAAAPGMAYEPKIYPYASAQNHCPAGLQPVTANGVICCGKPNQSMSYQSVMAHPVSTRSHVRVRSIQRFDCPAGVKGCN